MDAAGGEGRAGGVHGPDASRRRGPLHGPRSTRRHGHPTMAVMRSDGSRPAGEPSLVAAAGAAEQPAEHPGCRVRAAVATEQAAEHAAEVRHAARPRCSRPPSGTLPVGREHVDDLRQERREHRQQLADVDARAARQLLDRVRAERLAERARVDRLVRPGRRPSESTCPAEPAGLELAEEAVDPAVARWHRLAAGRPSGRHRVRVPPAGVRLSSSSFEMSSMVGPSAASRAWKRMVVAVGDGFGRRLAGRSVAGQASVEPGRAASSPRSAAGGAAAARSGRGGSA